MKKKLPVVFFARFALVIGSMFLALFLVDLFLGLNGYKKQQFVWGWANEVNKDTGYTKNIFALDSELIYAPNPNVGIINAPTFVFSDKDGFRPTGPVIDSPQAKTIVMIGDSFTWGFLLDPDQTYPYMVEKNLRDKGYQVNVKNAGVNGYGIDQEFLYFRDRVLAKTHPDMLVWNINTNDVEDTNLACLFTHKGEEDHFTQVSAVRNTTYIQGVLAKATPPILRNTRVANLVLNRIAPGWDRKTLGCKPSYTKIEQEHKFAFFIKEMTALSEKNHFKLVVTLVPNEFYLDPQYQNDQQWNEYIETLTKVLQQHAPHFVDLNTGSIAYLQVRDNLLAIRQPSSADSHVLGVSTSSATIQPLSLKEFFIDEGPAARGHSHLKPPANQVIAKILSDRLEELLDQP